MLPSLSLLVHDADSPPSFLFLPPPLHQVVGVGGWGGGCLAEEQEDSRLSSWQVSSLRGETSLGLSDSNQRREIWLWLQEAIALLMWWDGGNCSF